MRFHGALLRATFVATLTATAGCGTDPIAPRPAPEPTFVRLVSDFGDYIGGGQTYEYTHEDAVIGVNASGNLLTVSIEGDQWWHGEFQLPSATGTLRPGSWEGLTRYPFHNASTGGLSWSGEGRGCNTLTGSVTIDSLTYEAGALAAIDLSFVQHCEGGTAALRGTIHWRADEEVVAPGPAPVPGNLWQPPAGATPTASEYVYLQSDFGDWIGQGQTTTYVEPANPIAVNTATGRATVSVGGWTGTFQAMNGLARLEVGYYADVSRFPFHNTRKGGMDWSGNGRGCNTLGGWFAVDAITYSGTAISALDLRFEQRCENGTAALRGKIRWRA